TGQTPVKWSTRPAATPIAPAARRRRIGTPGAEARSHRPAAKFSLFDTAFLAYADKNLERNCETIRSRRKSPRRKSGLQTMAQGRPRQHRTHTCHPWYTPRQFAFSDLRSRTPRIRSRPEWSWPYRVTRPWYSKAT